MRNRRCPMCGEAPDLQEVKVPEIKKNYFSLSGEKLDRGRWFHFAKVLIREVSPPIFRSARTSCTTFGWSRPSVRAKNLDHLYTGIYAL